MPTIMELAEHRAAAQAHVRNLGRMNTPTEFADQVKSDAAYRLATDALNRCEQEYRKAIDAMSTAELINLSK